MSCTGNGYLTGNTMVPFPFEDGAYDSVAGHGTSDEFISCVNGCFADAGIYLSLQHVSADEWPSIGDIEASANSVSFILSCAGVLTRLSVSSSRERFPVVSGNEQWGTYFLALSSDGIRSLCELSDSSSSYSHPATGSSSPGSLDGYFRICQKCVTFSPESVSSIKVFNGVDDKSEGPHFVISGDVSVKSGNNMSLSVPEGENGMSISAVPGAGTGTVNCGCKKPAEYGSSIESPDGHTRIFNDTCYDIEPAGFGTVVVDGEERLSREIKIHAKCTACCTCEMYESIVNDRLAILFQAVKKAKDDIDGLLASYEDSVAKFNKRIRSPSRDDFTMSLSAMPIGKHLSPNLSNAKVKGKMSRCAFTATVRNSSFFNATAKIVSISGTGTVVEAAAASSDLSGNPKSKAGDAAGSVVGSSFTILPGRSLVVTFVSVKGEMSNKVSTGGFTGGISVSISAGGKSIGTISKTVRV